MSNSYQLKSHPNKTLYGHLSSVALSTRQLIVENISSCVSSKIPQSDFTRVAYVTGAVHDIGKGTTFFQDYLLNNETSPSSANEITPVTDPLLKSHSIISSLYCSWVIINDDQISDQYRYYLAVASSLAIQGHHGSLKRPTNYLKGLDNFDDKQIFSSQIDSLLKNIEEVERISTNLKLGSFKEFTQCWEDYYFTFAEMLRPSYYLPRIKENFIDFLEPYFLIKLLYSALLGADRMDAAGLKRERVVIKIESVSDFVKTIQDKSTTVLGDGGVTDIINKYRKILFEYVHQKSQLASLSQRIFTLTAPTGLGKTLTSMNFALNFRERIKKERKFTPRIIYVAPFISILDQNMKVFQNVFQSRKDQSHLLLLHHHLAPINFSKSVIEEQELEEYSTSQSELLIQGWDSEIIVTTFIQFFKTIFGRYASQLRRLHNLVGSIVILDEVQSIPFEYWYAVRRSLLFLSERFQFTVIMMTATQPLIFSKGQDKVMEIAPTDILNLPQRVLFYRKNQNALTLDKFCEEVNDLIRNHPRESILVEVNTIPNAIKVYTSLIISNASRKIFLLSSQIIPRHRKPRIDQIQEDLGNLEPLVLISTQVVEAGVDLDFDIAVRDIGPIDSIVQTAGRCNRNGRRKDIDSPFYIYRIVNNKGEEFAKHVYGKVAIDIANSLLSGKSNITDADPVEILSILLSLL